MNPFIEIQYWSGLQKVLRQWGAFGETMHLIFILTREYRFPKPILRVWAYLNESVMAKIKPIKILSLLNLTEICHLSLIVLQMMLADVSVWTLSVVCQGLFMRCKYK